MLDPHRGQHFADLQEDGSFGGPDPWLSQEQHRSSSDVPPSPGNFDRVLFRNLVEMVPLVESLMDRRVKSSYSRRASLNYTRTPSRESLSKKNANQKGKNITQANPSKKQMDGDNDQSKNAATVNRNGCDDIPVPSSQSLAVEREREELFMLQQQVQDLQKKLLEKDEALTNAEISLNEMSSVNAKLDELRQQINEKESSLKSAYSQLSDAKIKLADKQAALEKLNWEAATSNRKIERLQEDLDSMKDLMATLMKVFEDLTNSDSTTYSQEKDDYFHLLDTLPQIEPFDEIDMQKMEEAKTAYVSAISSARENPNEEALVGISEARLKLEALMFG